MALAAGLIEVYPLGLGKAAFRSKSAPASHGSVHATGDTRQLSSVTTLSITCGVISNAVRRPCSTGVLAGFSGLFSCNRACTCHVKLIRVCGAGADPEQMVAASF